MEIVNSASVLIYGSRRRSGRAIELMRNERFEVGGKSNWLAKEKSMNDAKKLNKVYGEVNDGESRHDSQGELFAANRRTTPVTRSLFTVRGSKSH